MAKPPPRRAIGIIGAMAEDSSNELFGLSKDSPRIRDIEVDRIDANPHQPRQHFDEAELAGLADSIARHGLLQPILVRKDGERYVLVAGERRLRARRLLGEPQIPAIITSGDPAEIALVENLQRTDLDPFELAGGLARLKQQHGYSDDELGRVMGRSQTETSRTLRLLDLPEVIRNEWHAHRHVSRNVLYEIGFAGDEPTQLALWQQAKAGATVGTMRQARKAPASGGPAGGGTPAAIGQHLRRIGKQLEGLRQVEQVQSLLTDQHRRTLKALRSEIDALLAAPSVDVD